LQGDVSWIGYADGSAGARLPTTPMHEAASRCFSPASWPKSKETSSIPSFRTLNPAAVSCPFWGWNPKKRRIIQTFAP